MITMRRAEERGHAVYDWLDTRHTFSFADYYDPQHMGFRALRVINEDIVEPGQGFGMHPHRDMEIITYVLSGALQHQDSAGNGSVIRHGDVQHMSAGSGILHSEFNASKTEKVHLLQIWILPAKKGGEPAYQEKHFPIQEQTDVLIQIASGDGANGSLKIGQDVRVYAANFTSERDLVYDLAPGRHAWLQVARGSAVVGGRLLQPGYGIAVSNEERLLISAKPGTELLLFDLA